MDARLYFHHGSPSVGVAVQQSDSAQWTKLSLGSLDIFVFATDASDDHVAFLRALHDACTAALGPRPVSDEAAHA